MWSRVELKEAAKANFKRVYKQSVIVCIIVYLITTIFSGSYNSATSSIQSSINYNYEQYNDIEGVDEIDGITIANDGFYVRFSPEGVIGRVFENIFSNIKNSFLGVSIAFMVFVMICIIIITTALRIFILNPIIIGKNNFFMGIREGERKIGDIFFLFDKSKIVTPAVTMLFVELFTFLWSLLLVIPGIIKSYEYKMIPYILSENPDIDRKRAFELSRHMMDGQKWNTFILDLSFIGWNILSSATFGIVGIFYVNPYIESTYAELYAVLREDAIQSEFSNRYELPGF